MNAKIFTYRCQYCDQTFTTTRGKFGAHCRLCPKNPNHDAIIKALQKGGSHKCSLYNKNNTKPRKEYEVTCASCGKHFTITCTEQEFSRKEKFYCSRSCANRRVFTEETNAKRSSTLYRTLGKKKPLVKHCIKCGNILDKRNVTGYCVRCYGAVRAASMTTQTRQKLRQAGLKSVAKQSNTRRSKNEIAFCNLCQSQFTNVKHNLPIFNGWDADIILMDQKIAILWNGPWHYKPISAKVSLECIQNRDNIKVNEIIKAGFTPYIIKDMGKASKDKVHAEFNKLLTFLETSAHSSSGPGQRTLIP